MGIGRCARAPAAERRRAAPAAARSAPVDHRLAEGAFHTLVIGSGTLQGYAGKPVIPSAHPLGKSSPQRLVEPSGLAFGLPANRYRGRPIGRMPLRSVPPTYRPQSHVLRTSRDRHLARSSVRGGDRFASTVLEVPRTALHGRDARDVPSGRWGQMEERLMANGKEVRSLRLRRLVYSMGSLVALVVAVSAGWKN
jgi:hypothetical protein